MANIEQIPMEIHEAASSMAPIVRSMLFMSSSDGVIPDPNTGDNQHCRHLKLFDVRIS